MSVKHLLKNTPLTLWLLCLIAGCFILVCAGIIYQGSGENKVLYCLGALGVLFLSTTFSIFAAYFLFIPRIKEIVSVLQIAGNGDLNIRVRDTGRGDEIGNCTREINLLISTMQDYIGRLHDLNRVGEELANALTRDEVVRIVVETVESQFDGKCTGVFGWNDFILRTDHVEQYAGILTQAKIDQLFEGGIVTKSAKENASVSGSHAIAVRFLYVPVVEQSVTTGVMVFEGKEEDLFFTPVVGEFAGTLSRLISNAFSRIQSIHELTRAESKYRALFMTMQGGIFRASGSGKLEEINPFLAAMGGYESVEEMLEKVGNISELFAAPTDRVKVMQKLHGEGCVKGMSLDLRRRDGSTMPALVTAHVLFNATGDMVAIEGNAADMTERTRREEAEREHSAVEAANQAKSEMLDDLEATNVQLRATVEEMRVMQRQLLQSEKMATIGTMAAGVAHELNNILSASVSYPELMLMQLPEDSEQREPLTAIRESGLRAVDIINDLLLLSKGASREMEFKELNDLLESSLQSLDIVKPLTLNPNLHLDVELCQESVYLRCTPLHVQKAFTNLVVSGLETVGEKGRLGVSVVLSEVEHDTLDSLALREGLYAILTITFNNPGVNREHYERIFDPFYLSSVLGKNSIKDGLGLTVAWNLIQQHEGTVVAESDSEGSGSFMIYLPVTREAEVSESAVDTLTNDLKGVGTILVVDDEPLQRDITGRMLTELGYQAYLVASGEGALDFIERRAVDLVLLDMLMPPGMNGYETYEKMLEIRPGQKVLVISGFSNSKDIEKTLDLGAGGLLKKPYSLAQLGHAVMSELG